MAVLILLAVKSVLLCALVLVILRLMRGRSAADRSFVAHAGLAGMLLLLPLTALDPGWAIKLPVLPETASDPALGELVQYEPAITHTDEPVAAGPAQAMPAFPVPWTIALAVLPALVLLAGFAVSLARLFSTRHMAEVIQSQGWLASLASAQARYGFKEGAALLVSDSVTSPVSWGFIRPVIIIDRDTEKHVEAAGDIVAHELAHVMRGDWLKLILARLCLAIFWFNPLVWRLVSEAHHLREEATDDAVLSRGACESSYAQLLVSTARHDNRRVLAAAHGVAPFKSSLKRRVERILDRNARRSGMGAGLRGTVLGSVSVLTVGLAWLSVEAVSVPVSAAPQEGYAELAATGEADADGLKKLDVDLLVAMQIHGVDAEYQKEIAEAYPSLGRLSAEQLITFSIHGIDGQFLRDLRSLGFTALSFDQIVAAAIHDINAGFIREMQSVGFENLTFDQLVQLRISGVDADYVRSFREAGYRDLTVEEVIRLGLFDIDPRSFEQLPEGE